jgi:hypothetical protein
LRIFILDEFPFTPARTEVRTGIHGVFKRPHLSTSSDNPEGSSPERRRLRFSFQINDVKDPTGDFRPRRLAPGGGEGRVLVAPKFHVNRPFQALRSNPGQADFRAQKSLRAAEGLPSDVRSDSVEAREDIHPGSTNQGVYETPKLSRRTSAREEAGI